MDAIKVLSLLSLVLLLAVACARESSTAMPIATPNFEAMVQSVATPTLTPDIDAMVEARVAAVMAAMPTLTAIPTVTPVPTLTPFSTPDIKAMVEARVAVAIAAMPTRSAIPTVTPVPTLTPFSTPDIKAMVEARLAVAIAAMPTRSAIPTVTPVPTLKPFPTATPTLNEVIARLEPAVVQIFTPMGSSGSGFFFNANGWVITNAHVVKGHPNVTVITDGGTRVQSEVIGLNDFVDLAVLKTNFTSTVSYLDLAHPSTVKVGDDAIALGFPLGSMLGPSMSVSEGIVSAIRDLSGVEYVQTSAAVNPGNSGGPLVNGRGQVMGINTFVITESGGRPVQNINFAISSSTVGDWLASLMAGALIQKISVNVPAGRSYEIPLYVKKGWEIGYRWKVSDESEGGLLDVNFELYDPKGNSLAAHDREPDGEGKFVVDVAGLHTLVFNNEFSLFTSKNIAVVYWRLPTR